MHAAGLDESLMVEVEAARARASSQRRVLARDVALLAKLRGEGESVHIDGDPTTRGAIGCDGIG